MSDADWLAVTSSRFTAHEISTIIVKGTHYLQDMQYDD